MKCTKSIGRKFGPCNIWEIKFLFFLKFGIDTRWIHSPCDSLRGSSLTKYPSNSTKKNLTLQLYHNYVARKRNDRSFLKRHFHCALKLNRYYVLTVSCIGFSDANKKELFIYFWHYSAMSLGYFFHTTFFAPPNR